MLTVKACYICYLHHIMRYILFNLSQGVLLCFSQIKGYLQRSVAAATVYLEANPC